MCGRFKLEINPKDIANFYKLIETLNNKYNIDTFESRDFHPGELCPVITETELKSIKWGFPSDKKLIINARSETIKEKSYYSDLSKETRCIIPANSFYEWHKGVKFEVESEKANMYFAGIRRKFVLEDDIEERFIIITAPANQDMSQIHKRMPVILQEENINKYLTSNDSELVKAFLDTNDLTLKLIQKEDQQLSFF